MLQYGAYTPFRSKSAHEFLLFLFTTTATVIISNGILVMAVASSGFNNLPNQALDTVILSHVHMQVHCIGRIEVIVTN